jgi:hypothetical protein
MNSSILPLLIAALPFFAAGADMVHGDAVGNDPAKEQLCVERTRANSSFKNYKIVPFEIDKNYLDRSRNPRFGGSPDVTFIAIQNITGDSQLVQCAVSNGTGKYGPLTFTPEDTNWRLLGKPKPVAPNVALHRCFDAVVAKLNRPNYDHSSGSVAEVGPPSRRIRYPAGSIIAGLKADQYDVVVTGAAMYKSAGPDMDTVTFTCLFSPTLEVKAIQTK